MKIILLLVAILLANNIFSQTFDIYKRTPLPNINGRMKVPTFLNPQFFKFRPTQQRGDTTLDKSVVKIELSKEYVGNNGTGADVYKAKPYNMPYLAPDSTFHSNMPVKGFAIVQH